MNRNKTASVILDYRIDAVFDRLPSANTKNDLRQRRVTLKRESANP
jgi:hypothetical protein